MRWTQETGQVANGNRHHPDKHREADNPRLSRSTYRSISARDRSSHHSITSKGPQDRAGRALEVAGDPPQTGASVPHPPHRRQLPRANLAGRPQGLPLLAGPLQPIPSPPLDGLQLLVRHPGGEHRQDLPEEGLMTPLVGFQVLGPLCLGLGQAPDLHPPVPQGADGPDAILPGPSDAVDGHDNQGVATGEAGIQAVPSAALLGPGGAGDADVAEQVLPGTPALRSRSSWDAGSIPRTPSWSRRLVRI